LKQDAAASAVCFRQAIGNVCFVNLESNVTPRYFVFVAHSVFVVKIVSGLMLLW